MKMKLLKLCILLMIVSPAFSYAQGHSGVGGGDQCKNEINKHRLEILGWIERDEAKGLDFTKARVKGWSYEGINSGLNYKEAMLRVLQEGKVKVTCFLDPARISDPKAQRIAQQEGVSYRAVMVGGSPSTCINYEDAYGTSHIDCNYDLIMNENSIGNPDYKTTHHEYASVAGVELRASDPSDMSVSDQLSQYEHIQEIKILGARIPAEHTVSVISPSSELTSNFIKLHERECQQDLKNDAAQIFALGMGVTRLPKENAIGVEMSDGSTLSADFEDSFLRLKYGKIFNIKSQCEVVRFGDWINRTCRLKTIVGTEFLPVALPKVKFDTVEVFDTSDILGNAARHSVAINFEVQFEGPTTEVLLMNSSTHLPSRMSLSLDNYKKCLEKIPSLIVNR